MNGWVATAVAGIVLALIAAGVWRRWVQPWGEIEELVAAVIGRKPPRKFLMTGNPRANAIGLALEQVATGQQALDRAATESARSLDAIVGALPDGLAVVDEKRRLQLTNPEFRRLFELSDVGVGMSLLEGTRDAAADRALRRALADRQVHRETIKIARADETALQIETSVVPFPADGDRSGGAVMLFRDVTQLQQLETMRRDFVANVSHELRTPLSIFRGYLESLVDDPDQSLEERVRIVEVMDRHAERLTLLVEDVLSLAQLEAPTPRLDFTEIDLPDFFAGILRDSEKRFATKQLHVRLETDDDLPLIEADENRLQEIVYNLLDNAVKYSPTGGEILLSAERAHDRVRISVADQGPGISASDLPRIFERFYRADKARSQQIGGTGLGLSIVKHIAQLHGGSVEARSEFGRGSTVGVLLPFRPDAVQSS